MKLTIVTLSILAIVLLELAIVTFILAISSSNVIFVALLSTVLKCIRSYKDNIKHYIATHFVKACKKHCPLVEEAREQMWSGLPRKT